MFWVCVSGCMVACKMVELVCRDSLKWKRMLIRVYIDGVVRE